MCKHSKKEGNRCVRTALHRGCTYTRILTVQPGTDGTDWYILTVKPLLYYEFFCLNFTQPHLQSAQGMPGRSEKKLVHLYRRIAQVHEQFKAIYTFKHSLYMHMPSNSPTQDIHVQGKSSDTKPTVRTDL